MMKYARFFFSLAILAVLSAPATMAQEKAMGNLGKVHFPVSCSSEAQQRFDRAIAILHSFWYEEAVKAFTAVTEADPNCAMGQWGIAMSIYYPLWVPPDRSTLQKGLSAVEKAKSIGAKTERERAYVTAIEVFYKDSDKLDHRTRALAYEKSMEQ